MVTNLMDENELRDRESGREAETESEGPAAGETPPASEGPEQVPGEAVPGSEESRAEARKALDDARRALEEAAGKAGVAAREVGRELREGASEIAGELRDTAREAGDRVRQASADWIAGSQGEEPSGDVRAEAAGPEGGSGEPVGDAGAAGGRPGGAEPGPPPPPKPPDGPRTGTGLDANLAAALSYVGWAVTGILFFFFFEPKQRFVRFHAMQSILLTAALIVVEIVLMVVPFIGPLLSSIAFIGFVLVWLMMMWKALKNEEYPLPFIGEIARSQADRAP
jgi:uncharacterized membrane protein